MDNSWIVSSGREEPADEPIGEESPEGFSTLAVLEGSGVSYRKEVPESDIGIES
jgi:hypothetical protein